MEKRITKTAFLHDLPDFVEKLHKSDVINFILLTKCKLVYHFLFLYKAAS